MPVIYKRKGVTEPKPPSGPCTMQAVKMFGSGIGLGAKRSTEMNNVAKLQIYAGRATDSCSVEFWALSIT
jgi:hypothetical protein